MATTTRTNRIVDEAATGLVAAIAGVLGLDLDRLTDDEVGQLLAINERGVRQLETNRARLAAVMSSRAAARAAAEHPSDPRAGERAARDVRRDLVNTHRLTPSQAKDAVQTGRELQAMPLASASTRTGELSLAHLRSLQRVLRHLHGDLASQVEAELVAAARDQDPVTFGKTCRRRLAELDQDAAMADLEQLHARRGGRVTVDESGMTRVSAELAGVDAEWVHTAVHAFRRPDAHGEHRSAEQRTADALVEVCKAAMRAMDDPEARGARPFFLINIPDPDPAATSSWQVGQALHTGPLPRQELERILGDSHLAAVLSTTTRVPTAVTTRTRTVPAGLWRALVARDGGCIMPGCDAPPAWCQVMHLDLPYRDDGRLALPTSALGCTRHHRAIDAGRVKVSLGGERPVIEGTQVDAGTASRDQAIPEGRRR